MGLGITAQTLLTGIVPLIDELFTTEEERGNAKLKLLELAHRGELAQMAVNEKEAQHSTMFVAGWRPAVGWTCVFALIMSFILLPIIHSVVIYYSAFTGEMVDLGGLPELDWGTLGPILLGLLGLGGLRTIEKTKGVARK